MTATAHALDQYEKAETWLQAIEHDIRTGKADPLGVGITLSALGIGVGEPIVEVLARLRRMVRTCAVEEVTENG